MITPFYQHAYILQSGNLPRPVSNQMPAAILNQTVNPCTSPMNGLQSTRVKFVDNYSVYLDSPLGNGSSGHVFKGQDNRNQEQICIKMVDIKHTPSNQKVMAVQQATYYKQLNHPNILRCTDVLQTGSYLYIVTELCNQGDLLNKIMTEGAMNEYGSYYIMKQICSALLFLKKFGIIHRDVKPSNVLLKDNVPKLADFGFAIPHTKAKDETRMNVGSPLYMSPEVIFYNRYSYASDVFSFGVMYYELLHLVTPWESNSQDELKAKLMRNAPYKFRQGLSLSLRQLISACLQLDPSKRPTIQQVAAWFG